MTSRISSQIGVTRTQIEDNLRDIDLVPGSAELFGFIAENGGDIIIVSASFRANVECGLEGAGLLRHVDRCTWKIIHNIN